MLTIAQLAALEGEFQVAQQLKFGAQQPARSGRFAGVGAYRHYLTRGPQAAYKDDTETRLSAWLALATQCYLQQGAQRPEV